MSLHAWKRSAWRLAGGPGPVPGFGDRRTSRRCRAAAAEPVVVGTPARIEVFPTQVKLDAPRPRMHLIVTGYYADGSVQDLTSVAELGVEGRQDRQGRTAASSCRPATASTEVAVKVGGHELSVPVEVAIRKRPTRSRSSTARWPCSRSKVATRAPATARPAARAAFACRCGPTTRRSTSRRWCARPSTAARICTSPRAACCCASR